METTDASSKHRFHGVVGWLYVSAFMVVAMMVIGAITRLTESGLSIVEWRPLIGVLPPLSALEWTRIFELYQQTSEYRLDNAGMDIAAFKTIFWWEYIHRLWGRLIGLVFGLPGLYFLIRRKIPNGKKRHILILFFLGGFQGVIGWWMVKSGFVDRTDVSQYRLTVHLGLAFSILGYLLWLAMEISYPRATGRGQSMRPFAYAALASAFITVLSGGLVAGSNAGFIYNTWPLMEGGFAPTGLFELSPWWLNAFENLAAIQFDHRIMAYVTVALVGLFWVKGRAAPISSHAQRALSILMIAVIAQIGLGVTTLLLVVAAPIAVCHQLGAIIVFSLTVWSLHAIQRKEPI
ncbi:MAG: COX15/CtaA family protein [Alphaproteobacteria bacterium]